MNLSFKEYLDKYLKENSESNPANGTYACVNLSDRHSKKLAAWLQDNLKHIEHPINNDRHPFHATLMFSRNLLPTLKDEKVKLPVLARGVEWKLFDQPNRDDKALVLILHSDGILEELHERFMQLPGATYDFDDFIPHLTVSVNYTPKEVPKVKPNFGLSLDKFVVEPLNLD